MTRYEKSKRLNAQDFKQLFGVKREVFDMMAVILGRAYDKKHQKQGRQSKLLVEDMLFLSLKYLRSYCTQIELAYEFEVSEGTVNNIIKWVEDTLIKDGNFHLPGKRVLKKEGKEEYILINATKNPIQRPKKNS
jgi:hypothetical protein